MEFRPLPPAPYLWSVFSYDPAEGILRWKPKHGWSRSINRWNTLFAGKIAGGINKSGHRAVHLDHISYYTHRIIWKMMTGQEPVYQIDHENNDHDDNRWTNLREATHQEQRLNQGLRRCNTSGTIGVTYEAKRRKWRAHAGWNGKRLNLGRYDTKEEAAEAYRHFAESHHGAFIHPINRAL